MVYDDGTTSRLARGPFLHDDDDGAAGRRDVPHGILRAGALAGARRPVLLRSTDQWAQMAIAGPKARLVLQALHRGRYLDAAFPFLAAGVVTLQGGLKARLFRISFSGELAYELAVPAGFGEAVADAIMEAGRAHRHLPLRPGGAERAAHRERPCHPCRIRRPRDAGRCRLRAHGFGAESRISSASGFRRAMG